MSKSIRLNKANSRKLVFAIYGDKHTAQIESIENKLEALAKSIYCDVFSPAERKLMDSLPKGWLKVRKSLKVKMSGEVVSLQLPENMEFRFPEYKAVSEYSDTILEVYDGSHKFSEKYRELKNKKKSLEQERNQLLVEIKAVVESHTTDKKLIESWPEVETIVRSTIKSKQTALAVPVDSLNKKLGIKCK